MPKGVYVGAINIANGAEDEFNDWYDTEHLPQALGIPGVLTGLRWIAVDDPMIAVTTHDLDSVAVFQSTAFLAVGGSNASPWTKRMGRRFERLMRFEGEQILPGDLLPPATAGGLLVNAMNVEPAAEAEFNEWYNQEHIPALAAVPGVLCARRFRATSSNHRYVALYHLTSPDVQATSAWKSAADSEWTRRMTPHFRDRLRLVCAKYVRAG